MEWITADDVAAFLRVSANSRIEDVTPAARAWVERCRPDLDYTGTISPDVRLGAIMYAALLYQQGSAPSGLPAYEDLGQYDDTGYALHNIYRLIGYRRPVVA